MISFLFRLLAAQIIPLTSAKADAKGKVGMKYIENFMKVPTLSFSTNGFLVLVQTRPYIYLKKLIAADKIYNFLIKFTIIDIKFLIK